MTTRCVIRSTSEPGFITDSYPGYHVVVTATGEKDVPSRDVRITAFIDRNGERIGPSEQFDRWQK